MQTGQLVNGSNLVENGSFERDILDGGLDWRVVPVDGAVVGIDLEGAFAGSRPLRIEFSVEDNLHYGHEFQSLAVQPNSRYQFSVAIRVQGLTTTTRPN